MSYKPASHHYAVARRNYLGAAICLAWAFVLVLCIARAFGQTAELELCYDRARWGESAAVANRHGTVVLNVDDGRGSNTMEARQWDAFGQRIRAVGGQSLGYVDFKDNNSKRKTNDAVVNEALAWLEQKHNGVFLDDATDNGADADVVRSIKAKYPAALIIANPGCHVSGPLKTCGAMLCESEYPDTIYYASAVVIAFVKDAATATSVRKTASDSKVKLLAVEPRSSYHVDSVEFQKPNPFAIK